METCDDSNISTDDGCSETCELETGWACETQGQPCSHICGDQMQVGPEVCDDGSDDGAGCLENCTGIAENFTCETSDKSSISFCELCGDSISGILEECDDGNNDDNDGCSSSCLLEPGFTCSNIQGLETSCLSLIHI